MIVRFHPEAGQEVIHSVKWYFERSQTAAVNFVNEIDRCLARISESSEVFPRYLHGTCRILMKTFPYSIVFRSTANTIDIIAVAHSKRRPGYWKRRLKQSG